MIQTVCRVVCDDCGFPDAVTLDHPQPETPEAARERVATVPRDAYGRLWSVTPAGEDLCPRCRARRDCDREGHTWGTPWADSLAGIRPWRPCTRCHCVQDIETGEIRA